MIYFHRTDDSPIYKLLNRLKYAKKPIEIFYSNLMSTLQIDFGTSIDIMTFKSLEFQAQITMSIPNNNLIMYIDLDKYSLEIEEVIDKWDDAPYTYSTGETLLKILKENRKSIGTYIESTEIMKIKEIKHNEDDSILTLDIKTNIPKKEYPLHTYRKRLENNLDIAVEAITSIGVKTEISSVTINGYHKYCEFSYDTLVNDNNYIIYYVYQTKLLCFMKENIENPFNDTKQYKWYQISSFNIL